LSSPYEGEPFTRTERVEKDELCEYHTDIHGHANDGDLVGIMFPTDFDDAGPSVDERVFVARCDECNLFTSDIAAAKFVAAVFSIPYYKLFDNEVDEYHRPFFKMTLKQAENLLLEGKVGEAYDAWKSSDEPNEEED
jgi:hypothetical protein